MRVSKRAARPSHGLMWGAQMHRFDLREKRIFEHQRQTVVDGKMILLHAVGFLRRHSNRKIAESVKASATSARKTDGARSPGASGFNGQANVAGIARRT